MIRIIRNRIAVISFRSEAFMPAQIAVATQALYIIEPKITAVVVFTKDKCLKILIPIITLAKPITMVPVPADISKKPLF
jgi:hypothetical protein